MKPLKALYLMIGVLVTSNLFGEEIVVTGAYERQGSLLSKVQTISGDLHDEVLFDLGKKGMKSSLLKTRPNDWVCERLKSQWRCRGNPVETSYFSFDPVNNYRFSDKLKLEVNYQGRELLKQRIPIESIKAPALQTSLEGILDTPARYTPGGYFIARPINPDYTQGRWRVNVDGNQVSASNFDRAEIEKLPINSRDISMFTHLMPSTVTRDSQINYTYDDPWQYRLVDAPATGYSLGDPMPLDCLPKLDACQTMAPVGGTLCICGCFPDETSGASLLIDGKPVSVSSGSSYVTSISLADVEPGRHRVSWSSGLLGSVEFEAVRVAGKLDKELIMKGGSAALEFWMEGTQTPLSMQINSPSLNIGIQGGNTQTATTSGGAPNDIQRILWANEVGDFSVGFAVDLPPCPCGSLEQMQSNLDHNMASHPMNMEGRGDLLWPNTGLSVPVRFASEDFLSLAPRPPISTSPFKVPLRQLGLTAKIGELAPFTFETRADMDSYGDFSNIKISDQGFLRSADVEVSFRTEFTVDYSDALQLEVGMKYDFGLDNWGFKGKSPGLGNISFSQKPGIDSSIVLDELQTDVAGTLLHGWADISLHGQLEIDGASEK